MATNRNLGHVILSVVFKKGFADKNRLPLVHVINALEEIELMIREVGGQIQREAGVENPDGNFGIELLATRTGLAVRKGSLAVQLPITRNVEHGMRAAVTLIDTTNMVEKNRAMPATGYSEQVLRRLPRIGKIQEQDKTELHLTLTDNGRVLKKAKLGEKGLETLRSMEVAELEVAGITLYGKLRQLKDLSRGSEETGCFWGDLLEDSGRKWRICFKDSELERVLPLFRKQVVIVGDVTYFKTNTPRVDVSRIDEDQAVDYLSAFDRFGEIYEDVFQDRDPQDILKDIRE